MRHLGDTQPDRLRIALMKARRELTHASRILDFGCGAGRELAAFRALGFDAHGFDIPHDGSCDFRLDWTAFRLPFPDEHFDFVYSLAVMEHVQNHDAVLKELARVTKRQGVHLHVFPARWQFIEPHMKVPLGGIFKPRWWFALWALAGVRNEYQAGQTAQQVAATNARYARTGLNYRRGRELLELGRRHFASCAFRPALYDDRVRFPGLHSRFRQVVLWLEKQ